jgi:hypothetical protein
VHNHSLSVATSFICGSDSISLINDFDCDVYVGEDHNLLPFMLI